MDRPGRTPEEHTDNSPTAIRGVIVPDNIQAQRAQLQQALNLLQQALNLLQQALNLLQQALSLLQQALNLLRKGLQSLSQSLDIMERVTQG